MFLQVRNILKHKEAHRAYGVGVFQRQVVIKVIRDILSQMLQKC